MSEEQIEITELLAGIEIDPFEAAELDGAAVIDAFVIFRYQRPDWKHPRAAYASTPAMTSEEEIGLLALVSDRLRDRALRAWVDDDE